MLKSCCCIWGVIFTLLSLTMVSGCRTVPMPPVDLTQPAWTVQQGQAVWVSSGLARGEGGVAGELLIATQPNGSCWVQFSKPPFNLVTAQCTPSRWQVEWQQGRRRAEGRGMPPARWVWFQLALALQGKDVEAPWQFARESDGTWRLSNADTDEGLEGYVAP
jgi:hypothetical protein